jgi:RNA polymerase sigma-70 factor (ECF subfamily)
MDEPQAQGLQALYQQCRPELLHFLLLRSRDLAEAEDICQEIWLRLHVPDRGPIANGRSYLFRIAHNLLIDRMRQQQRRLRRDRAWADHGADPLSEGGERPDPAPNAEQIILDREEAEQLARALETLPAGAQRVFRMHKIDGLSHGEVAAALGISLSGVEKHMAVAMKYLRRALVG